MNKKTTKRSLLASALALALCVIMLVGTTFAWFTDTASTSVNKIQAGNLKVDIVGADGQSLKGETLKWVKAAGHENEEVLWEPGAEYALTPFKIVNKGNLALKYEVTVNGVDGSSKLLEAIDFTVKAGERVFNINGWDGILLPADKTATSAEEEIGETGLITISGKMRTDAGNEYQGLSIEGIGITVKATQYTYEYDSIGNQYDANAPAILPEGITADSFTDGNTLYVVNADGTTAYYKNLQSAMGGTSAEGSVIYAKPNATVLKNGSHHNILGDLTVYGNGADFSDADISAEEYVDFSGDVTVNFINTKNLEVWGTRKTGHSLTLNFENCYNDGSRLYYVNKGGSGENHVTVKNCEIKNIESPIYGSNTGSLLVENCTFRNVDVAVNINTKLAGQMTTTIKDCVFVDCARNAGSFAAYNGVIRLVNTNAGCTDQATVENCRFVYSDSAAAMQGDILLGDTRDIATKPCYPIELTVKNTNAVVQEYNNGLATRQTVAGNAVIHHQGIVNAVQLTPSSNVNYQSNTTYIFTDGNYGAFTATMERNRTNVTFLASSGATFDSVTVCYHGGDTPTADAIAAKNDSTLTVKGFWVSGDMDISTFDRNVVVQGNSVKSIKVKTNHVSDMDVRVLDNAIGAGDVENGYGVYFVPNTTNYDLTISGNTFTGTKGHAIAVQGNGDGSAVTAANSISVTGNVFDSYGLNGKLNRAAFKIWYDTKLANESKQPLNDDANALIRSVQENNSFGVLGNNCVLGNFHDTIVPFN